MIAPFSKFKDDLRELGRSVYSYSDTAIEDFENSLAGWECYGDLRVSMHQWWEVFYQPADGDSFDYPESPKITVLSIGELFVDRGYMTEDDIPLIDQCGKRIADKAFTTRNLTYPRGSVSLFLKSIDAAYEIQSKISDPDLHGILDI